MLWDASKKLDTALKELQKPEPDLSDIQRILESSHAALRDFEEQIKKLTRARNYWE